MRIWQFLRRSLTDVLEFPGIPLSWHIEKGYVLGCDFAGTVVSIGSSVPDGLRQIGERVAGFVHGGAS